MYYIVAFAYLPMFVVYYFCSI